MTDPFDQFLSDLDTSGLPDEPPMSGDVGDLLSALTGGTLMARLHIPGDHDPKACPTCRNLAKAKRAFLDELAADLHLTKQERKQLKRTDSMYEATLAAARLLRDRIAVMEGKR